MVWFRVPVELSGSLRDVRTEVVFIAACDYNTPMNNA
jgi:hypothetical protein